LTGLRVTERLIAEIAVYNFTVEIDHNYYALTGATPLLVHNANYGRDDFHNNLNRSERGIDIEEIWLDGDLYIQDDGRLVRVLDQGNGVHHAVIREPGTAAGTVDTGLVVIMPQGRRSGR